MTNKERSAAIRAEIKKLGYNSRQISVRSGYCGYSDYTHITVKDLSIDFKAIEKIGAKFESIRYDEYSGEILEGANTYISVRYDYNVLHNAVDAQLARAQTMIENTTSSFETLKDNEKQIVAVPCSKDRWTLAEFKNGENAGRNLTYEMDKSYIAYKIAEVLVLHKAA